MSTAVRLAEVLREKAYRARRNRLQYYRPYGKQREFHAAGSEYRERLFSAGNQLGKTWAGSYEVAMHLTGRYPDWWEGRTFNKPIQCWAASVTSEVTRDGIQRLMFGTPGVDAERGCAAIPADAIVELSPKANIPKGIAIGVIKHGGGGDVQAGESVVLLKSYDQGREKFQAGTIDVVWADEEPEFDIYMEMLTRTNASKGMVFMTFTPLLGMSQTVRRFLIDKAPGTHVTNMGIFDAEHYTREEAEQIIASYPEHEREARAFGKPVLGSGAVFPIAESQITCDPFEIPPTWPRIAGMDIGWDHPTAGAWWAHDRNTDTMYLYDTYKASRQPVSVHASAFKARGELIPVAWPHDALQAQKDTGRPMRDAYRAEGLRMLPEKASFEDGSAGLEAGIQIMYQYMTTGRFKVFKTCEDWLSEYRTYHRKDGVVVAEYDDVLCLHPDTQVITDSGTFRIASLVGLSGKVLTAGGVYAEFSNVRRTRIETPMVSVLFDDGYELVCTPDHKIMLAGGGWVDAKDSAGQFVQAESARTLSVLRVCDAPASDAYCMEVALTECLAIGNGVIVHNCASRYGFMMRRFAQPLTTEQLKVYRMSWRA